MNDRWRALPRTLLCAWFAVAGAGACGDDDDGAQGAAQCTGVGCTCAGAECACTGEADCKASCQSCALSCDDSAKCNADAVGAVAIECSDDADCKGHGGDCRNGAHCDLKGGADSIATCSDAADCKLNLGPGSRATCSDSAHCEIKCESGTCEVECGANARCLLDCGLDVKAKPEKREKNLVKAIDKLFKNFPPPPPKK